MSLVSFSRSDFNPRPLTGATSPICYSPGQREISIHAPSRGRLHLPWPTYAWLYFNPRPLTGATSCFLFPGCFSIHFNPRPLTGATKVPLGFAIELPISIHAPSRGRLPYLGCCRQHCCISIHAPSRGRLHHPVTSFPPIDFNPRPLTGATVFSR